MTMTRLLLPCILGAAALAALSCGEGSPVGMPHGAVPPRLSTSTLEETGLLTCSPLAADTVTVTMGSEGGVLAVGPHTLSVPVGALEEPVTITAVAPSDSTNRVELEPAGLVFGRPASLTLSYANCDALGSTLPKRIAYVSDALSILEYLLSFDDAAARTVTGQLQHFSGYAVAW